jgi:hypothetical protein
VLVFVVGFSFSLSANVLWTLPGGPVRILGGALASVALPAGMHMFPRASPSGRVQWVVHGLRCVVMALIGVGAVVTTFAHAFSLLVAHGEDWRLAALYPAMTELLVVSAMLARWAPARPAQRAARTGQAAKKTGQAAPVAPAAVAPDVPAVRAKRRRPPRTDEVRRREREAKRAARAAAREQSGPRGVAA